MSADETIPLDVRELVQATMHSYGNAQSDGRPWNINTAMRFAEAAVMADRAARQQDTGAVGFVMVPRELAAHIHATLETIAFRGTDNLSRGARILANRLDPLIPDALTPPDQGGGTR